MSPEAFLSSRASKATGPDAPSKLTCQGVSWTCHGRVMGVSVSWTRPAAGARTLASELRTSVPR